MAHGVCPWWLGYLLAGPLRRFFCDPDKVLTPYITKGMTVLDVGCGMGFFSLPLAQLAGSDGKVICIDLQARMIEGLIKRAVRAGLADRIDARVCTQYHLPLEGEAGIIDFALVFALVHEVPDKERLLAEICEAMKPRAQLLLAEPSKHVREREFEETVKVAANAGFEVISRPEIRRSRAILIRRK